MLQPRKIRVHRILFASWHLEGRKSFGYYPYYLPLPLFNFNAYEVLRLSSLQHQACSTNVFSSSTPFDSACSASVLFIVLLVKQHFVCRTKHPT